MTSGADRPGWWTVPVRWIFASFPVWSLSLLAWVPAARIAILSRRRQDTVIACLFFLGTVAVIVGIETLDQDEMESASLVFGSAIMVFIAVAVVHAVIADHRRVRRLTSGVPGQPGPHGDAPGGAARVSVTYGPAPDAHQPAPATGPAQPWRQTPAVATPVVPPPPAPAPHHPAAATAQAPTHPLAPPAPPPPAGAPPADHAESGATVTTPDQSVPDPSGPAGSTGEPPAAPEATHPSPRIRQAASELDELGALLRREDGGR